MRAAAKQVGTLVNTSARNHDPEGLNTKLEVIGGIASKLSSSAVDIRIVHLFRYLRCLPESSGFSL